MNGNLPFEISLKDNEIYPPIEETRNLAKERTEQYYKINRIRYDKKFQEADFQWHRAEHTLRTYIRIRHICPSLGVMVWGAIGYTSESPLVRIDGTLYSAPYISGVLRLVALHIIPVLRNPTFQQDKA
ncbi:transposable element Tcb1 transposase [Trichonephila clavipes]|nr:transposable element Tcb1 transposase [Trichonephila clavipes]